MRARGVQLRFHGIFIDVENLIYKQKNDERSDTGMGIKLNQLFWKHYYVEEQWSLVSLNYEEEFSNRTLFFYNVYLLHWYKKLPSHLITGFTSIPIEDQLLLTKTKSLDLLMSAVICQSCNNEKDINGKLHFSMSERQYNEVVKCLPEDQRAPEPCSIGDQLYVVKRIIHKNIINCDIGKIIYHNNGN